MPLLNRRFPVTADPRPPRPVAASQLDYLRPYQQEVMPLTDPEAILRQRESTYLLRSDRLRTQGRFLIPMTVKYDEDPLDEDLSHAMAASRVDYRGREVTMREDVSQFQQWAVLHNKSGGVDGAYR